MKVPMVAVRHHYDKAKAVEYKPGETFHAEDEAAAARLVRLKKAHHAPPVPTPPVPTPPPTPKVVAKALKADPPMETPIMAPLLNETPPLEADMFETDPLAPVPPRRAYHRRDMKAEGE